jgi:hypothetical protein
MGRERMTKLDPPLITKKTTPSKLGFASSTSRRPAASPELSTGELLTRSQVDAVCPLPRFARAMGISPPSNFLIACAPPAKGWATGACTGYGHERRHKAAAHSAGGCPMGCGPAPTGARFCLTGHTGRSVREHWEGRPPGQTRPSGYLGPRRLGFIMTACQRLRSWPGPRRSFVNGVF